MNRRALLASLCLSPALLAGRARASDGAPRRVATPVTIIADKARQVAGGMAEIVSITRPGADIRSYQPTPGDLVRATGAGLILANGLNPELWFQPFLDKLGDAIPTAVVSAGVTPMPIRGGDYAGKPNPHGWMALDSALDYVDNIAADPANATGYRANARGYKARIAATIGPLPDAAAPSPTTAGGWSPRRAPFPTSRAISA